VKELGTIDRFNAVDILQTKDFIKLYNCTYIEKILLQHSWINQLEHQAMEEFHTPMLSDNNYQRKLKTTEALEQKELKKIEEQYGFGYRQGIRELIYALVT
jgi:hypothetical protein